MDVAASGVVLAGGASRRMGRDKALMVVDGQRLVDRAVDLLRAIADDVVVASGSRTIDRLAVPQVRDQPQGAGPLGGLAAGLVRAEHQVVHVLACDLPHADLALLRALADRWRGEPAVIPSADGRPQPLHAVWAAGTAAALTALLDRGVRSVMDAVDRLGATILTDDETAVLATEPRWATNLNRPSDLQTGGA